MWGRRWPRRRRILGGGLVLVRRGGGRGKWVGLVGVGWGLGMDEPELVSPRTYSLPVWERTAATSVSNMLRMLLAVWEWVWSFWVVPPG